MRAAGLEQEREAPSETHVAERRQEQAGVDATHLDGGQPLPFDPRMLLGLQATAGNAAVSGLIAQARGSPASLEPVPTEAAEVAAAGDGVTAVRSEAPPPEVGAEGAATGPAEADLAQLDAEAEAGNAGGEAEISSMSTRSGDRYNGGPAVGRAAIAERARPAVPSVAGLEPEQALGVTSALPPAQFLEAYGGVAGAVDRSVGLEHERLSREPPSRARHPGAPATVESPASQRVAVATDGSARTVPRVSERHEVAVRVPPPLPAAPPLPGSLAIEPAITGTETGELSAGDSQKLASAIASLPRSDNGSMVQPGPLPRIPVAGNADPNQVHEQQSHLDQALTAEHAQGRREAGTPLGEDAIFPVAPPETLTGWVAAAQPAAAEAAPAPESDEAVSLIAQQERGSAIRAVAGAGIGELAAERQLYAESTGAERTKAETEMSALERANVGEQASQRTAAQAEVAGLRGQWSLEQQQLVDQGRSEGDAATRSAFETATATRRHAEEEAAAHYREGQLQADAARREGEQHAIAERQRAQSQGSSGFLGLVASAARSVFDAARSAVQAAFERSRQLVRAAIERAQQFAQAVMDRARQTIVAAIRFAGEALTAIGDRVLVAFPALRNRFRAAIRERIGRAEATVNRLSLALRQAVQSTLNVLGVALAVLVGRLRGGMQAVLGRVRLAVLSAVDFARGAIAGLGTFAVLVRDVAANPGRWLTNLAAAAQDGIRNHLWPDLKLAVQGWFSDKVESVVGLGAAAWSLLRKGGITTMQVASVAWEGLQSLIPPTIVWILIEKLVALIVPAAAAVMLIIQALQAAWGSVGRIIQAFDAFMAFLKGVRWGNAGPLFGKAVAAGAVAVIEFVSQFLLQRLMGGAGKVAGKLRALAKRIGNRLAGVGRGLATGAKWVGGKLGRAGRAVRKLAGQTAARPQVRWHAWRLGRQLETGHPRAFEKLRQVKADPSLDPRLKLEFLTAVRGDYKPGVDARELMTTVVRKNSDRFCLQGRIIPWQEVSEATPLTKLISLRQIFEEENLLNPAYKSRFVSFEDWVGAIRKDPTTFDPATHMNPKAEIGRWWSPVADADESTIEEAVDTRQLGARYEEGALRVYLHSDQTSKMKFRKPTAFDAMFFDPWQPPPDKARWGFIRSKGGAVTIREAVTDPILTEECTAFETLTKGGAVSSTGGSPEMVKAVEALP